MGIMTPSQINKAIKQGEVFWMRDPQRPDAHMQIVVGRAKSLHGVVFLQPLFANNHGKRWHTATEIRRAGSNEWLPLTAEGVMTWAIN